VTTLQTPQRALRLVMQRDARGRLSSKAISISIDQNGQESLATREPPGATFKATIPGWRQL